MDRDFKKPRWNKVIVAAILVMAAITTILALGVLKAEMNDNSALIEDQIAAIAALHEEIAEMKKLQKGCEGTIESLKTQINMLENAQAALNYEIETVINLLENSPVDPNLVIEPADSFVDFTDFTITTNEKDYDKISILFLEKYGDELVSSSLMYPNNAYAISVFEIISEPDVYEIQMLEDDISFSVDIQFALKPYEAFFETTPWWAGNTKKDQSREGWLKMSRTFTFKISHDGVVACVSAGTGR